MTFFFIFEYFKLNMSLCQKSKYLKKVKWSSKCMFMMWLKLGANCFQHSLRDEQACQKSKSSRKVIVALRYGLVYV